MAFRFGAASIAVVAMAVSAAHAEDIQLDGVEAVKQDVRQAAAVGGLAALRQLRPWRIVYRGNIQPGKKLNVSMQPTAAFTTVRENDRSFIVTLANPEQLFTGFGNLKEMGVQVNLLDATDGSGTGVCSTGVFFRATGTNQPINLQQIQADAPRAMSLSVFPEGKARFDRLDKETAYFVRTSGDTSPVQIVLKLEDSDYVYTYTANLPSCGTSGFYPQPQPQPQPQFPPQPQQPPRFFRMVEAQRYTDVFRLSSSDFNNDMGLGRGINGRTQYRACSEAKDDLFNTVFTQYECQQRAEQLYSNARMPSGNVNQWVKNGWVTPGLRYIYADFSRTSVVQGSGSTNSCRCRQVLADGDRDCTYNCTVSGSVNCQVEFVVYDIVPAN